MPFLQQEELQRLNRELRAISNCNQTLMRAVDEQTLLGDVCRIVCAEAGYRMAWVGYAENDDARTVRPVASAGFDDGYIASARLTWAAGMERGLGPGGMALRDGETVYVQEIESDPRMAPWHESAARHGYGSIIALPLKDESGVPFGVLLIYSAESNDVTPDELRLLEELAGDLAFGIMVLRVRRAQKRIDGIMRARLRLLEFASSHSMDELLTAALDEIEAMTGSTIGFYHFVEENQQTISLQNWSTSTLKNMCTAAERDSHYPLDQAGVWVDCVREPEGHAVVVREAVVPIFRGNQIKAIIGVGNKTTDYDQSDIEIVSQLGDLSWDITERMRAEETLLLLNRELRAISNCNQTLMRAVDEQTLLDEICRIVCDEAGYRMAWVGYPESDDAKTLRPVACSGAEDGYLEQARISWADTERGRGPSGTAIRTGKSACILDFATDPEAAPWRDIASQRGYRSCISLPLKDQSATTFGVLTIYSSKLKVFTPDEVRLLEELAGDLAFGITALRTRAERERMEESLATRERDFRTLAEHSPDVIVRYDLQCRRIYVNPAFERLNHLSSQQVLGACPVELSNELAPMAALFTQRLKQVMESGIAAQIDLQWIKEGKENCWFVRAIPELDAKGEVASALTIWTDITSRKQLETALRESEQKFRSLAENSPENIFRYDRDGRVLYANHWVESTLCVTHTEFNGRTPLEMHPQGLYAGGLPELENYQATLRRVISSGEIADVEMHVPDPAGALRTHSVRFTAERDERGNIVGALAFGRDITEKSRLEEQLRQSQKMEAIGKLAGGVAHDFNNILTAIIGFSSLAKIKMQPEDPQRPLIDQILASSNRAAHLTQGLLAFSRKQVLLPKPVDLNSIVQSIEKLLGRLIGEDIEFTTRLAGQNLIVMADAGQMEQVLMNLVTNARDAMPEGGALTITTEWRAVGEDFTNSQGYGKAGSYALITVSDTGIGMDASTRERVFEPFFTTKEVGKGTGLGLSMAYGIIRQHEGFINVDSEPRKGTTFRIYLPLAGMEVEEAQRGGESPPPGGTETLLLAEDDEVVRGLTCSILRDFGYHVIEAADGLDALEKIAAHEKEINLMILDVIMPKMNGKEVLDTVKQKGGHPKTLFISGYTADFISRKGVFDEGVQFVAKPLSPFELLKKIRNILDEGP